MLFGHVLKRDGECLSGRTVGCQGLKDQRGDLWMRWKRTGRRGCGDPGAKDPKEEQDILGSVVTFYFFKDEKLGTKQESNEETEQWSKMTVSLFNLNLIRQEIFAYMEEISLNQWIHENMQLTITVNPLFWSRLTVRPWEGVHMSSLISPNEIKHKKHMCISSRGVNSLKNGFKWGEEFKWSINPLVSCSSACWLLKNSWEKSSKV